jgi:hypothetical protein
MKNTTDLTGSLFDPATLKNVNCVRTNLGLEMTFNRTHPDDLITKQPWLEKAENVVAERVAKLAGNTPPANPFDPIQSVKELRDEVKRLHGDQE